MTPDYETPGQMSNGLSYINETFPRGVEHYEFYDEQLIQLEIEQCKMMIRSLLKY
jgi:hypothetical protein